MKTIMLAFVVLMSAAMLAGQNAGSPEERVARAKTAAGNDYQNLFNFLCTVPTPRGSAARGGGGRAAGPPPGTPDRSTWYAEPAKVFDNLYFVGQTEYSAWAITTSEGIILIDTLFDYSVEEEVAGGLKKLGLDPATIRYAVVTHPHPDHHGGAKLREDGARHMAALWGGTGLNADRDSLEKYIASAQRFDRIAQQAGADIILSNHTDWDGSKINLPRVATRAPGTRNPYIVGTPAVRRYLEVASECATARLLRLN